MNEEQQAQAVARWLASGGRDPLPDGVDPDVVEGLLAIRPDLAPAPRLRAEDILADVRAGPFARAADDDDDDGAQVVPFPVPPASPPPDALDPAAPGRDAPRGRSRWAGGVVGLLAAAAAVLVVVGQGVDGGRFAPADRTRALEAEPAADALQQPARPPTDAKAELRKAAPAKERTRSEQVVPAAPEPVLEAPAARAPARDEAPPPPPPPGSEKKRKGLVGKEAPADAPAPPPPSAPSQRATLQTALDDDGAAFGDAFDAELDVPAGALGGAIDEDAEAPPEVLAEEEAEPEREEAAPPPPAPKRARTRAKEEAAEADAAPARTAGGPPPLPAGRRPDPTPLDAAIAQAETLARRGDPRGAARLLEPLIAAPPEVGLVAATRATRFAIAAGDLEAAEYYASRGLSLGGEDLPAWSGLQEAWAEVRARRDAPSTPSEAR